MRHHTTCIRCTIWLLIHPVLLLYPRANVCRVPRESCFAAATRGQFYARSLTKAARTADAVGTFVAAITRCTLHNRNKP